MADSITNILQKRIVLLPANAEIAVCHTNQSSAQEAQLISEAQNGMPHAIDELLSRNRMIAYRVAYRMTGNALDAEDVVQETMLHALEHIAGFRGEARFPSWLVAITVNAARSAKRKQGRVRWVSLDEPLRAGGGALRAESLCDNRMNPEQKYLDKERHAMVRRAIARQPPKFRMILRACDLNEVSVKDVARTLRITSAAAKSRLFRARRMLLSTVRKQIGGGGWQ
jgi:RNA polymerase sigma-70 factor, ECF subfamily